MAAPKGSHNIAWPKYAGKQDKYCFGHLNVDGYYCQETKPLAGGFEINTNTYSIAVAVPHLVAEYIGKGTTEEQIKHRLKSFSAAYKAYDEIALLETDEEVASYTTFKLGLGDGGDLAPVISHHPLQGPKAFKRWDIKRTSIITRNGQRWISFKDNQDRELLQISLIRKKEFPWEQ